MAKLSVNVNKVATLVNTRDLGIPASSALTDHLPGTPLRARDHRSPAARSAHIRPRDVYDIAELLKSYPAAEFNIEGNLFHEFMHFVEDVRPTQCTLVPDEWDVPTSNHGWDFAEAMRAAFGPIIKTPGYGFRRVSLFLDPNFQIEQAGKLGANERTAYRAHAAVHVRGDKSAVEKYAHAAHLAKYLGLGVNAGHDLNSIIFRCSWNTFLFAEVSDRARACAASAGVWAGGNGSQVHRGGGADARKMMPWQAFVPVTGGCWGRHSCPPQVRCTHLPV